MKIEINFHCPVCNNRSFEVKEIDKQGYHQIVCNSCSNIVLKIEDKKYPISISYTNHSKTKK